MLVEEMPIQHPQMDRLNPHCLNTVRVTTYTDRDEVHIILATLSSATDAKIVDNFAVGGMLLAVDLQSGKMCIRDRSISCGMESISVRIMAQASSTRSMALSGRKRSEM